MWSLGWNPTPTYLLLVGLALLGLVVLRHPAGLLLCVLALVPRWKAISLINRNGEGYLDQAKLHVKGEGASRLGVHLDTALCNVSSIGRGKPPFGSSFNPQYEISVVYIDNQFFAVYQAAIFNLQDCTVQLPQHGDEIYYRHVSAINYHPPHVEVTLSDGKTIKRFTVGSDGESAVVSALRAKLRAPAPSAMIVPEPGVLRSGIVGKLAYNETNASIDPDGEIARSDNTNEERYCYLRVSKLRQLLSDP